MRIPDISDTIVALATPPGIGAIGIIRLSGPEAIPLADRIFKGKVLAEQPTHTAHFGRIEAADGRALDEVLATVFHDRRSYTGQPTVEFGCHGSPYIQQEIIQLCLHEGARMAEPGEFTLRAFLNGRMDLSQAEAVADLIASQSEAGHTVALRQLRGGFRSEIQQLRSELIDFASLVELELDFGEEDVEFADRDDLKKLVQKIRAHLRPLIQSFALGNAIKIGVNTVIAGRPNAGKSTLLNALLNEERAIVSDIPGTTRDTIEEVLNIKGVQFRLIDTAGIREAQDAIEAIGVAKTMEKIEQAAILVYVWDVAGGMTLAEVRADLQQLAPTGDHLLVVCNKMDRNPLFQTDWLVDPTLPGIHPYLLPEDSQDSLLTIHHSSFIINCRFRKECNEHRVPQRKTLRPGRGQRTGYRPHHRDQCPTPRRPAPGRYRPVRGVARTGNGRHGRFCGAGYPARTGVSGGDHGRDWGGGFIGEYFWEVLYWEVSCIFVENLSTYVPFGSPGFYYSKF